MMQRFSDIVQSHTRKIVPRSEVDISIADTPIVVDAVPVTTGVPALIETPLCPTCKFSLRDDAHGWLKVYDHPEKYYNHRLVPCPTCSGDVQVRRALRHQEELVARLFGASQIPYHARNWEFVSYPQDADQKALQCAQEFVQRHCAGDEESKRGLWLAGAAGRCKTGLAICAIKEVIRTGNLALFVMTLELMNRLRASFGKDANNSQDELLTAVTRVPWLVLDDIATERPTPYVLEQFYYIIEKRRSQGLYTIFTSNLSTKDLEAYWRPEGVAPGAFHAGVRVVERIREYCTGIPVQGRNQREKGW